MYKTVEVAGIIGSVYVAGHEINSISIAEVKGIMDKVNKTDQFISPNLSRQAVLKALTMANQNIASGMKAISIPPNKAIHLRFIREYYKLDSDTRAIVSQVIKEYIKNGKI